jgi:hypothetical protein
MHLIYETEIEAIARADQQGEYMNYSYWTEGEGTRWLTGPEPTADGKWALNVEGYELDEDELAAVVETISFPEFEE